MPSIRPFKSPFEFPAIVPGFVSATGISTGGPGSTKDLWTFNMTERWEQWHRDFAEFGHIKFIEQSFDGFPDKGDGYGGGFGDFCHRPDLRSGPGYWEVLGDGSDARSHA